MPLSRSCFCLVLTLVVACSIEAQGDPFTLAGVPGGASDRGTIAGGLTATYTAPDNLTVASPVSVSITARGSTITHVLSATLHVTAGTSVAP